MIKLSTKLIKNTNSETIIDPSQLFARVGVLGGLHHMLQSMQMPVNRTAQGRPQVDVLSYAEAKEQIPEAIPQLYRLELMFAPRISFMDGLMQDSTEPQVPELLRDFESPNSFVQVATVKYESSREANKLADKILGYVPNELRFAIGYAQGSLETNPELRRQGFESYICSVITDHDFRMVGGTGAAMMKPIFDTIDPLGRSYLSTWVDTGAVGNKVNLSHHPGVGFWYGQHFDPMTVDRAMQIRPGLQAKHISSGIFRENYALATMEPSMLKEKLYGPGLMRKLGRGIDEGPEYIQWHAEPFAVMPKHYETGWTGIIMERDPEKVTERLANPQRYGIRRDILG